MLLNRDDLEFIWNELSIYLHFILVAVFLLSALYAWQISKVLSFTIGGATLLFFASAVGSVLRRNNMTEIKQPYADKEFTKQLTHFLSSEGCITGKDLRKVSRTMLEQLEKAYQRGYYDGKRN